MSYEYLTETGVIIPDTSDTRKKVVTEWKQALGEDLITDDETPQGLLINAETEARQSVVRANAAVANQINPNIAEGVFLDAIWALTGGQRVKATYTKVMGVLLTGVSGTVIPEGTLASTGNYQFKTLSRVILNAEGKASVNFQAVDLGSIPCAANTLNKIVSAVLGWETVNNPHKAQIGKEQESDQTSRIRRRKTLALQGVALPESIVSNLYNIDGVKSLAFRENVTSEVAIIDGITMKPHSIWACVDGGSDATIAQCLLRTKSLGAGYNGDIVADAIDSESGQSYSVQFDRPERIAIYIKATIKKGVSSLDPQTAIPHSIMKYVNGEQEGEEGFIVGSHVSSFELASAINREYHTVFVKKLEVSTNGTDYSVNEIDIALNQLAVTTEGLITVVAE